MARDYSRGRVLRDALTMLRMAERKSGFTVPELREALGGLSRRGAMRWIATLREVAVIDAEPAGHHEPWRYRFLGWR